MPYEKHGDSCLCLVCATARGQTVKDASAKVMRALMREWDVDSTSELPDWVLPIMAWTVGFYGHRSGMDVHGMVDKGTETHRKAREGMQGIEIEVVRPELFKKLLKGDAS